MQPMAMVEAMRKSRHTDVVLGLLAAVVLLPAGIGVLIMMAFFGPLVAVLVPLAGLWVVAVWRVEMADLRFMAEFMRRRRGHGQLAKMDYGSPGGGSLVALRKTVRPATTIRQLDEMDLANRELEQESVRQAGRRFEEEDGKP